MNSSAPIADQESQDNSTASKLSTGDAQDETDPHADLAQGPDAQDRADDDPTLTVASTLPTPGFRYFTCFEFQDSS